MLVLIFFGESRVFFFCRRRRRQWEFLGAQSARAVVLDDDSFRPGLLHGLGPFDVYLYDGDHTDEAHRRAVTEVDPPCHAPFNFTMPKMGPSILSWWTRQPVLLPRWTELITSHLSRLTE